MLESSQHVQSAQKDVTSKLLRSISGVSQAVITNMMNATASSLDSWVGNYVFVERVRSVNYEEVFLKPKDTVSHARRVIPDGG